MNSQVIEFMLFKSITSTENLKYILQIQLTSFQTFVSMSAVKNKIAQLILCCIHFPLSYGGVLKIYIVNILIILLVTGVSVTLV